jgi:hypothetical protein
VESVAVLTLPLAVLAQCVFAAGHRLATRRRPDGDAWLPLLTVPSLLVTGACVILVPSTFGLADPSECAPLSDASAWLLSAALAASLLAAAILGLWTAGLAASRAPAGRPLLGELVAVGAAVGLAGVLVGGTSC